MWMKPGHAGLEHGPVGGDPGGAHGGQRDPMVSPLPRNHLGLFGVSQKFPVIAGRLDAALRRLAAPRGEEEPGDAGIGEIRDPLGQPDGRRGWNFRRSRSSNPVAPSARRRPGPAPAARDPPPRSTTRPGPSMYSRPSASVRTAPSPLIQTCPFSWRFRSCRGWIRWARSRVRSSVLVLVMKGSPDNVRLNRGLRTIGGSSV